jgi:hypothetical protein
LTDSEIKFFISFKRITIMKNYRIILAFFFFVTSVQVLNAQKRSVKFDLAAFTEISVRNNANVILLQGQDQAVTATAREETIGKLIVEVKDRSLIIRYPTNTWFDSRWDPGEVTINVTMPQIDDLSVSGSGSITAGSLIYSRIIDCLVSGSGFISLVNLKSEKITSRLSGTGHLQLAGEEAVAELKLTLSGPGGVKTSGIKARNVNVLISGSGSCTVHAIENLNCKIAGSGSVTYYGNPAIETTIVGSGTVKEGN